MCCTVSAAVARMSGPVRERCATQLCREVYCCTTGPLSSRFRLQEEIISLLYCASGHQRRTDLITSRSSDNGAMVRPAQGSRVECIFLPFTRLDSCGPADALELTDVPAGCVSGMTVRLIDAGNAETDLSASIQTLPGTKSERVSAPLHAVPFRAFMLSCLHAFTPTHCCASCTCTSDSHLSRFPEISMMMYLTRALYGILHASAAAHAAPLPVANSEP